jgi:integrase
MLRYAKARQVIEVVPSIDPLKVVPTEIRFLTVGEAKRLLEAAAELGPTWHTMVVMGLLTGMRIGELRALHWEDIATKRGVVRVHRSLYKNTEQTTKTVHGLRTIKLDEGLLLLLNRMLRIGPLVFCREPKGEALSYWACKTALAAACKAAGLKRVTWHTLRHTFASHLVMLGYPIRTVQDLLGHSDIKMTMRYSHLTPDAKAGAVNALAKLLTT